MGDERIRDFNFFIETIRERIPFALLRYGDGEVIVMEESMPIDQVANGRHGIIFNPGTDIDKMLSAELFASLNYTSPNYYVGVPDSRKWRERLFKFMMVDNSLLTSNEIFMCGENLGKGIGQIVFLKEFLKLLESNEYVFQWICNEKVGDLSLRTIDRLWTLKDNGWKSQYKDIMVDLLKYVLNVENEIFLFSAAMFSEILIHHCWSVNPNNTYIDIGSVFDPIVFEQPTRSYHAKFMKEFMELRRRFIGE